MTIRVVAAVLMVLTMFACSSDPKDYQGEYRPPFIPITFAIDGSGHVSVTAGLSVTTPIGTFEIKEQVLKPDDDRIRLVIVHPVNGAKKQDAYDIAQRGPITLCLSGRFQQTFDTNMVTVEPLDGDREIQVVDGKLGAGACSSVLSTTAGPTTPKTPRSATRTPTPTRTPIPTPTQIRTPATAQFAGEWQGSYNCFQGIAGLTLTIDVRTDGAAVATFAFYQIPQSTTVIPSGRFAMTGKVSGMMITLRPDHWIDQPPGFSMVDVQARYVAATPPRLEGRTCGLFPLQVQRS